MAYRGYAGQQTAYASAYATVQADSVEDILDLVLREEFRTVEVLEPDTVTLNRRELGRLLAEANARVRTITSSFAGHTQ